MSGTSSQDLFERYLPNRIAGDGALARSIRAKFQFVVTSAPGENWVLDFTGPEGEVRAASEPDADCTIILTREALSALFKNPGKGALYLMTGKLKVRGDKKVARHLLKLLS